MKQITELLMEYADEEFKELQIKLIPGISPDKFLGIRMPQIKNAAKKLIEIGLADTFINCLPHTYYEENGIHSYIITKYLKDFDEIISRTEEFLPYIDNWATCDSFVNKKFKKNKQLALPYLYKWLNSSHTYTKRYAVVCMLSLFLDSDYENGMLEKVAEIRSDEYYVNIAVAWYFSVALIKQYEIAIKFIENKVLPKWTHNKAIQKAQESFRIDNNTKLYLKSLKIK